MIIGNVGRDPEIRMVQDGGKIANFSVATTESRKDKNTGERIDKTEWHRIVVFNEHFTEVIEKYVRKGSKLYVEGQLQTRKWTDAQGIERYVTEIVVGRYRGEIGLLDSKQSSIDDAAPQGNGGGAASMIGDIDQMMKDDIPF
jgi:single-strand DNA-binding protein